MADEGGMDGDGTEVGVHAEQEAKREQACFRFQRPRRGVERGVADGAQQHGVGLDDRGARLVGERIPRRGHRTGADGEMLEGEIDPEALRGGAQHALRLCNHLRPDAVSREHGDREPGHDAGPAVPMTWRRSKAAMRGSSSSVRPISSRPESSISRR